MTYIKDYTQNEITPISKKYPTLFIESELGNIVQIDGEHSAGVAYLINVKNSEMDVDFWKIEKGILAQGHGFKSYAAYDFALEHPEYQGILPIYQSELANEDVYEKDYETFNSLHEQVHESLLEELHEQGYSLEDEEVNDIFQGLVDSTRAYVFEAIDWQYASSFIDEKDWSEDIRLAFKKIEKISLVNN
ncbi:hypothetical protein [Lactococcus lactis]|uniref:hypothetical protein n=1 Tax=Lactococcus lactis TaxID=1358 RepID=UPI0028918E07|nr:hypothetical protein [Lactococcus lactis]MDT2909254.1 hypothetical protein [Lactococcus lactis]MDT2925216.1 hypothetical protein [Lactococcus lactis]MDT2952075.1 hypothetical protein [Lactococcus lactis]